MSKYVDSIIGHAVGDAMGVPTEFCIRESLLKKPVVDMIGSAKTGQPAGSWSDDTSMEIATIDSYIENNGFNYEDIMNKWSNWIEHGEYAANDEVFDVGRTCLAAIKRFKLDGIKPVECGLNNINMNGNGSLMRILPVALYSYSKKLSNKEINKITNEVSSLTHAHDISKLGCYIYVKYVIYLLNGLTKEEAYEKIQNEDYSSYSEESINAYFRILKNNIKDYSIDEINSSGYVVDTLECALWILLNSNSYQETIIASTNIGQDTDTIGAIAGSMAGIIYGINAIPEKWLNTLKKKDYLIDLALKYESKTTKMNKDVILGVAIGDIAGSVYEINNCKTGKNFVLLNEKKGRFTDDTVMTIAVAKALLDCKKDYSNIEEITIKSMVELGNKYPSCGFGQGFYNWIKTDHKPYNSFGNGAAMRISPVGVAIKDINEMKKVSEIITNVSHNHPDSVLGANAVCVAINMSLNNKTKEEIEEVINNEYFNIYESRENEMSKIEYNINCVETVKKALQSFLNSYDFEDAIRNAISVGGDSDTIGAITGSIASAFYGIPEYLIEHAMKYLDNYLISIHDDFYHKYEM